jgi:beta-N-acetylhexosaminidase
LGTRAASLQALKAGIDMLCIGNNLLDQEREMADIADSIEQRLQDETLDGAAVRRSIERVRKRKALLTI